MIREADRLRTFAPLPGRSIKHRASLYADDLVVFVTPAAEDLTCLQQILLLFAGASRLIANIDKCDRCWATLPARAEKNVVAMIDASMTVIIGDGASAKLWTDNWSNVGSLCSFAPQLFADISPRGKKMSVNDGLFQNRWAREIHGADTVQVLLQYLRVWAILRAVVLDPHVPDRLTWKWSPDGKYSVSSTYKVFFRRINCAPWCQGIRED